MIPHAPPALCIFSAFFNHIDRPMRIMAELLRRNRAPAEVMLVLAAEEEQLQKAFAKAGRNEPCPYSLSLIWAKFG